MSGNFQTYGHTDDTMRNQRSRDYIHNIHNISMDTYQYAGCQILV